MASSDELPTSGIIAERWIRVPTIEAEKYRRIAENHALRQARYRKIHPNANGKIPLAEREFIVWDGEGPQDTGYSLLGASTGDEIYYPSLSTVDCLDLLLSVAASNPYCIHVSFGFGYDVSNILRDLSWRHLAALHSFGRTVWRDYSIEHIPGKWFRVKRGDVSVKIYDVFSFFQCSLTEALEKWEIGPFALSETVDAHSRSHATETTIADSTKNRSKHRAKLPYAPIVSVPPVQLLSKMQEWEIVSLFKRLRAEFLWSDIEAIRQYMRLELKYTKLLMQKLRVAFLDAGYSLNSWHGPAALSRVAMRRHGIFAALAKTPVDIQIAARYAFFGGRFEQFFAGHANQRIYTADLNSAYPYYCSQLPNLSRGQWRYAKDFEADKFAVYYVKYHAKPDPYRAYPLPHRDSNHNVVFPHRTEGWYWSPEVDIVSEDPDAEIVEGWIFDEDDPLDRPFAWIVDYFRRRQILKKLGNPAEFTFKLIINSIYGCLAQRKGWDKKKKLPPATHQLEYAGYITSGCRAAVYRLARELGDNLISIDTDGVSSFVPFDLVDSKELGGWELTEFEDGIFWQSGIYALKEDGEWKKNKMRGIPRGSYSAESLLTHLKKNQPLKITKRTFYSYGLALNGNRELLNKWIDEPHEYVFGGTGKRQHATPRNRCTNACRPDIDHHRLSLPPFYALPFTDMRSAPHNLPWVKRDPAKQLLDDLTLYEHDEFIYERELVNNAG